MVVHADSAVRLMAERARATMQEAMNSRQKNASDGRPGLGVSP